MELKLRLDNHLLWLVTPIVTGSVLATSPILAATLASSEAQLTINNFSHTPQKVRVLTDTNTFTIASDGSVTAQADANATATFEPNNPPSGFSSFSLSTTSGEGNSYFGLAQSFSGVIAYDFLVEKNDTFSFNFDSFLDLQTSIDSPKTESASAAGEISLKLYDSTNGHLIDYFTLSGNLTTLGNSDTLELGKSTNITFNPGETSFEKSFGGTQEVANASIQGHFSRIFDGLTNLTLVEVNTNEASVGVPEPPGILEDLLFFCLIGVGYVGYVVRNKVLKAKSRKTW